MWFFSHVPRITWPKNLVPRSKGVLCSPCTDTQTRKWMQRTPFQGFSIFFFNLSSRIGPKNQPVFPVTYMLIIRPILDNRLKEKILKPWKCAQSSHSVCVCVCTRATDHSFWVRNLIFGLSDPWNIRKKRIFLFFEIFIFTLFIGIFRFFPYIPLVNFLFQATGHSFSPRNVIFGLREPCSIENWRLLTFFWKFNFSRLNGSFFRFFWQFFNITLVILEISMACDLSF